MVPVLVDDWLYMDIDGQAGTYGREEIQRSFKGKMKSVVAAFIDCETKIIATQALVNASFSNEYLIQEERLASNAFQVVAAKKEKIEAIYQYFKPVPVKTLVPYAVGIRAFLKSKALLPDEKIVLFVDDLKTQAIVTILEGLRFTAPRRISMRDIGYMISEIKRSQQAYLSQRQDIPKNGLPFMVVSNNREWLSAFVDQGFLSSEDIAHVEEAFPILEGLKNAKFGMHFALPEELVLNKKRAITRQRLRLAVLGIMSLTMAVGIYAAASIYKNDVSMRLNALKSQEHDQRASLQSAYKLKFRSILNKNKDLPHARLYYEFIQNIPSDYMVKGFDIHPGGQNQWQFSGLIYPADEHVGHQDFQKQGMFAHAQVFTAVIDKKLGQMIDLIVIQ